VADPVQDQVVAGRLVVPERADAHGFAGDVAAAAAVDLLGQEPRKSALNAEKEPDPLAHRRTSSELVK
jgi:hypothetical protein